ncbi:MAG: hypothetical protein JWP40_1763 [Blastococcus sp.]|jgi:DNA-binding PucR family transcriptional regulator|nr:hypothetical protein [Blastococcus sp.]
MLADERTLWAWVNSPTPHELGLSLLRHGVSSGAAGLRIAVGPQAPGLAGFRGSLRDALRARAVAETAEDHNVAVVAFDDVAVAALLTSQSEDLQRWIARVLGNLAADDPGTRELRETVRVFLESAGSYNRAATQLHLHKNTVYYRVRKAEQLRGRPLREDRLALEVAPHAASLLRHRLEEHGVAPATSPG